jgi:hypothetical protein
MNHVFVLVNDSGGMATGCSRCGALGADLAKPCSAVSDGAIYAGKPTGAVILSPSAAAEAVGHEEQLRVWANALVGRLSVEGYLRDDLEYSEGVELERAVMDEIKSILRMAFDHPECRSVKIPTS